MQQDKKNLFNGILDMLPVHVYWYGLDGVIYGMNAQQAKSYGLSSPRDAIGRNLYDITDKEYADEWQRVNAQVIASECVTELEEKFCYPDGQEGILLSRKAPWYDDAGKAIGIIGVSLDITEQRKTAQQLEAAQADLDSLLESVIAALPGHIYWQDKSGTILGCNDEQAESLGYQNRRDLIGKTSESTPWHDKSNQLMAVNQKVMATGEAITIEEPVPVQHARIATFLSKKAPLKNKQGDIIGIVGVSFDITSQKEAERLRLENEIQRIHAEEQEKFAQLCTQLVHDIKSPAASVQMLVNACDNIPEKERVALRQAAERIQDIANRLINQYQKTHPVAGPKNPDVEEDEERTPTLMSVLMMEILSEKRYNYQDDPIQFEALVRPQDQFVFTMMQPGALKRAISNLVNNAVEATPGKKGTIRLKLVSDGEWVRIIIQDNGTGMPPELIQKVMNKIMVTQEKEGGSGLGLTQVRETVEHNHGKLSIESVVGKGTSITLTFPRILPPNWIADQITLQGDEIIMILDDDDSIHGAWDSHFAQTKKQHPKLIFHHFTKGSDFLNSYENFTLAEQKRVFFLSDYELLSQDCNGLDLIEETNIPHSILVTSHYASPALLERAANLEVKILPKQLASEVSIVVEPPKVARPGDSGLSTMVLIDDDMLLLGVLRDSLAGIRDVRCYTSPKLFLADLDEFTKHTPICFDYNFNIKNLNGLVLAKQLHERGYHRLYMISGMQLDPSTVPSYVTILGKDNLSQLAELN